MEENTKIFLDFLIANGFRPENYQNILEIDQDVPNSISKHLKDYRQFLLSKKVDYSELVSYQIKGANGYINQKGGITVPISEESDEYFKALAIQSKIYCHKKIPYFYPNITDFDALIAYYDLTTNYQLSIEQVVNATIPFIENHYIGFITDSNNEVQNTQKLAIFSMLLEILQSNSRQEYTMIHDSLKGQEKELYLMKKKIR